MKADTWMQLCRCGRMVKVSTARRETTEKVSEEVIKHWFDADGNLERITGNGHKDPDNTNPSNVVI